MRIVSWNVNSLKPRHDRSSGAWTGGNPMWSASKKQSPSSKISPKKPLSQQAGIWPRWVKKLTTVWPCQQGPNRSGFERPRQL